MKPIKSLSEASCVAPEGGDDDSVAKGPNK